MSLKEGLELTELQMIPIVIRGLHSKMIKTFAEFYTIAKTVENNFKRNFNSNFQTSKSHFKTKTNEQTFTKAKKSRQIRVRYAKV